MLDLFLKKIKEVEFQKKAIILNNEELLYSELTSKIDELYLLISKSFNKKKVVVISGDYSFNSIALVFALSQHKCIFIPLISKLTLTTCLYLVTDEKNGTRRYIPGSVTIEKSPLKLF